MPWNQPPATDTAPRAERQAVALRRSLTAPEKRLWWHLRHRLPIEGTHFCRQVAIGPYVADFCCLGARLVIEVDGEQHGHDAGVMRHARRTAYLTAQGFRVLRFSNRDVMCGIDVVLDTVLAALGPTTPTPSPFPQGGGESDGRRVARQALGPTTPTPNPSPQWGAELRGDHG